MIRFDFLVLDIFWLKINRGLDWEREENRKKSMFTNCLRNDFGRGFYWVFGIDWNVPWIYWNRILRKVFRKSKKKLETIVNFKSWISFWFYLYKYPLDICIWLEIHFHYDYSIHNFHMVVYKFSCTLSSQTFARNCLDREEI